MDAVAWPGLPGAFPAPPTTLAPTGGGGGPGAGLPVVYGPFTVEYTDILHDGDAKALWTPQAGDLLLRVFYNWITFVAWNEGTHVLAQVHGVYHTLDFSNGSELLPVVDVLQTTDPLELRLQNPSGTDPTQGHVDIYALVARAVVP